MLTSSAKQKGRLLQKFIRDAILKLFPELQPDDVRSTSMGNSGVDIQLSPLAQSLFPYAVEAKNQQVLKGIYKMWSQAEANKTAKLKPLLVIKMNNQKPLAILDFEDFMRLNEKK